MLDLHKNATGFDLTNCWQVYKGRHTATEVFAMIDAASMLWKPLIRSRVKCQSQSGFEKATFRGGLDCTKLLATHSPSPSPNVSKHRFIFIQLGEILLSPFHPAFFS